MENAARQLSLTTAKARSASALDVAVVAESVGKGVPYAQAAELLDENADFGKSCQVHENGVAKVVVVCEPGLQKSMGALHPAAALYERFVNLEESVAEHANFRETLRKRGIKVLTVREILRHGLDSNLRCRIDLEDLAMEMLTYQADSGPGESFY